MRRARGGAAPLWALWVVFLGCGVPPKTAELVAFEQMRGGEYASVIREQMPQLYEESEGAYHKALAAHNDREPELAMHHTRVATIFWRTATARVEQKDFADAMKASQHRLRQAEERLEDARRRKTAAIDAIARQERILAMQSRLAMAEEKAQLEKKAAEVKAKVDAAVLALKEAESIDAAQHAPGPFNKAQAALTMALDAFQAGRYKQAEENAAFAAADATAAVAAARPLHEVVLKRRAIDEQLKQMLSLASARSGVEARIEARGLVVTLRELFKSGEDEILNEKFGELDLIVELAKRGEALRIIVEGHTDNRGRPERNLALSDRRAQAAVRYLSGHGVGADRLQPLGRGDEEPVSDNSSRAGRAQNRRLNFVFLKPNL